MNEIETKVVALLNRMYTQGRADLKREMMEKIPKEKQQKDCWCQTGEGCGCKIDDFNKALSEVKQIVEQL